MNAPPRHLLTSTVTVERLASSNDATGAPVVTWSEHLPDVPAAVQELPGAEDVRGGRKSAARRYQVFVAADLDIAPADRVIYVDPGGVTRTLEITQLQRGGSGQLQRLGTEEHG